LAQRPVVAQVLAQQRHPTRGGLGDAGQHPDQRGLAGSVRPEQPVHASVQFEVEPGQRGTPAVPDDQVTDLDVRAKQDGSDHLDTSIREWTERVREWTESWLNDSRRIAITIAATAATASIHGMASLVSTGGRRQDGSSNVLLTATTQPAVSTAAARSMPMAVPSAMVARTSARHANSHGAGEP